MARVKIGNVRQPVDELKQLFAPAGYGLGEDTKQYIQMADLDNTFVNGTYWLTCIGAMVEGQVFNYAIVRVTGMGSTHCIQELFPFGLDMVLIRRCYNGDWPDTWGRYSWVNSVHVDGY